MPQPEEKGTDMSNVFAVTTPYVDGAGAGYFETHGALEFSPHSTALTTPHPPQHRRQISDTLPQWKEVPRFARPSPVVDIAPNGDPFTRPGIQASNTKTQPDNHQAIESDYDEMRGIRDDSDAEARMRRLLNQLELGTPQDSRTIYEEDWASSSSSSLGRGVPPRANARGPSHLTRVAFARQRGDSKQTNDPVPRHDMEHLSPQGGDIIDFYTEDESGLPATAQSQFPNSPPNVVTRPPPPRYKSAPSTPNTTGVAPLPSRSPRKAATTEERYSPANYTPSRKSSLIRHRGSEQNLHDQWRQQSRSAPPVHAIGRSNSTRAAFMNSPATPASSSSGLPGLIPDAISRSSSFASIQTRLVTPTDSAAPTLFGSPHLLDRIDERPSMDYNEMEAAKGRRTGLSRAPSHALSEVKERGRMMETRPSLRLATPLPSIGPPFAEHPSGKHLRSTTTTTVPSISDTAGTESVLSFSSGPGGFPRSNAVKGGVQRSYSRSAVSAVSEFSSFTDSLSQSSEGKGNSMQEKVTPSVLAATAFAMTGTMPVGIAQSKAERAADKARQKAEKAAKKAAAALLKVELEREAKAQQEETKRTATENKRQAVEARKKENDDRQRQAELAMTRLLFGR